MLKHRDAAFEGCCDTKLHFRAVYSGDVRLIGAAKLPSVSLTAQISFSTRQSFSIVIRNERNL